MLLAKLAASPSVLRIAPIAPQWSACIGRAMSSVAADPPPPPVSGAPTDEERAASLPPEQLAKALLAGNCRAQLTTVVAGLTGSDDNKVTSSVVSYLAPRGEAPVVLLSQQDSQHLTNLDETAKASLATGHISPPWFIQRLRETGWLPRRVALLGSLQPLPAAEVRFAYDQAVKAYKAAPAVAAALPPEGQLASLAGFRLAPISRCIYVDEAGRQHGIAPDDLDGALVDPLALSQHDLLAGVNQSPAWPIQLQLFAAAYLGVANSEVLLSEADRLGFTLLGRPTQAAEAMAEAGVKAQAGEANAAAESGAVQQQRWRQFRIGSGRELRDAEAFMGLLEQMKAEVMAAATGRQPA